jgi:hypothetical protein
MTWDDDPRPKLLAYEVRMLPRGLSSFSALPEHYTVRVVRAENALGARTSPEVEALISKYGLYVVETAEAGRFSSTSSQAIANAEHAKREAPPDDMRGVNDVHAPGFPRG